VRRRDHLDLALRELELHGIRPRVSKTNGSHIRVTWTFNGRRQFVIASATPGTSFARLMIRNDVRRLLREHTP
jgi:hypothetical protein